MEFVLAPVRRLQEIDLNIAECRRQEEEYPRRMQAVDEEIQARQQEMEGEKEKLHELVKNEKSAKIEADGVRGKIAHYKDQLLSVKTNKEYSALLKEIGQADSHSTIRRVEHPQSFRGVQSICSNLEEKLIDSCFHIIGHRFLLFVSLEHDCVKQAYQRQVITRVRIFIFLSLAGLISSSRSTLPG